MCLLSHTSGLKMSSFEEQVKVKIDANLDELQMLSYDNGWNAVLDIINGAITEKHLAQDKIAVDVLVWLRERIAGIE